MTCLSMEDLTRLSMDLFDEPEARRMRGHLAECDACRTRLGELRRDHIDHMRMYEAFDRDHDRLRDQLMAALPAESPQRPRAGRLGLGGRRLGDFVMTLNSTRNRRVAAVLVPAACILIAVGILLSPRQESAFAAAIEHIRQATTIVCRVTTTLNVKMEADPQAAPSAFDLSRFEDAPATNVVRTEKLYMNADRGVRRDAYEDDEVVSMTYAPAKGPTVVVSPVDHAYYTYEEPTMPEALKDAVDRHPTPDVHFMSLSQNPDRLIRGVRNLRAGADRELGRETQDGREIVGFEIAAEKVGLGPPWADRNPDNRAELWLDAATSIPVRLVFRYAKRVPSPQALPVTTCYAMTIVFDRFEWDPPLAPDTFEPVVPDDFVLRDVGMPADQPPPDEAAMIKGLRVFSEIAGHYPSTLSVVDLSYEVAALSGFIQAKRLAARHAGREPPKGPTPESMAGLRGLTFFAFLELAGREPEYFGKTVQPGDADAVLVRWRQENGDTRVVYGDLRLETKAATKPGR